MRVEFDVCGGRKRPPRQICKPIRILNPNPLTLKRLLRPLICYCLLLCACSEGVGPLENPPACIPDGFTADFALKAIPTDPCNAYTGPKVCRYDIQRAIRITRDRKEANYRRGSVPS